MNGLAEWPWRALEGALWNRSGLQSTGGPGPGLPKQVANK